MSEESNAPVVQETPPKVKSGFDLKTRFYPAYIILHHPQAKWGVAIVVFFILVAIFAPIISPGDPAEYLGVLNQPPSREHIMGVDPLGRDVFGLVVWGARITLVVGFATAAVAMFVATVVGMTAGYFRGIVDDILVLIINLFLVIPGLPLLIILAAYLQPNTSTVILALSLTGWAFHARIIRAMTMSLREKDYVAASLVVGEGHPTIIFRQILPNLINLIVGGFIGSTIYAIGASTALAFLGLTNMEEISWGTNLFWAQNGNSLLLGAWWVFVPSGVAVALVAFGLAWINYGMDEITNPRLRSERELRKVLKKNKIPQVRATPVQPHDQDVLSKQERELAVGSHD